MPHKHRRASKGGREAEVLKVEGDWKDAMSKALKRGKPPKTRLKAKKRSK